MNFLKSNYKMMLVIFISIVVQIVVLLMLLNQGDKEKKEIDSTLAREDTNNLVYDDDMIDAIDESKNKLLKDKQVVSIDEADENIEVVEVDLDKPVSQVGKVDVHVGYNPTETNEGQTKSNSKTNTNKAKSPNKNTSNTSSKSPTSSTNKKTSTSTSPKAQAKEKTKTEKKKVDSLEQAAKAIVGTWKSENDSNGSKSDMYWEFFKNGTYQNYDEEKSVIFDGKYTVNSSDVIKVDQENVYLSATGNTRKQNESFLVDISFQDDKTFSVTDIDHFDFSNYKKIK